MKLSAPVYHLKRRARDLARKDKRPLSEALDRIAREEGLPAGAFSRKRRLPSRPHKSSSPGSFPAIFFSWAPVPVRARP